MRKLHRKNYHGQNWFFTSERIIRLQEMLVLSKTFFNSLIVDMLQYARCLNSWSSVYVVALQSEVSSEPCQTSKMEGYAKLLTVFAKRFRCLTPFWIRLWQLLQVNLTFNFRGPSTYQIYAGKTSWKKSREGGMRKCRWNHEIRTISFNTLELEEDSSFLFNTIYSNVCFLLNNTLCESSLPKQFFLN